ncbi:hypothetical protein [Rhizobacter sp. SG703]|uniref:hypothetical protein n=1 Tax=Rhizobacter sp. SG703 TaxID=2587140 RepID=UPI0014462563|nr:hypothetical protein [Rhizobacter sp. SG703]NKI93890.1 hypothetical protein [Rhizobacter sp. SG703]
MPINGPRTERQRLCLQLILHTHLHQLEMPLTEQMVSELCVELGLPNVPSTHRARVAALQVEAAKLLPESS